MPISCIVKLVLQINKLEFFPVALSPPLKERLILILLSATNLETQKEVVLLILITRHLFCFTGRLR